MKTLLIAASLMLTVVACNNSKDAQTEFKEQRMEANKEYNEEVQGTQEDIQEARQERAEDLGDAREDLNEAQREEVEEARD